jgi:hypothetical protein
MGTNVRQNIVTNGLVMYLDAGSRMSYPGSGTTWSDLSGNKNSGSLVNSPTFDSNNQGNIVFNGTNNYMTAAGGIPSGTSLFTLSFWVNFTSISGSFGGSIRAAVLASGNTVGTMEFVVQTIDNTPGTPYLIYYGHYGPGGIGSCVALTPNMPLLQYHNIVLVRDGAASNKIYQNGVMLVNGNVSNNFTAGTFNIAAAPSQALYAGYLNGRIANILRYNRALSDQEINQNYNATKTRFGLT